MMNVDVFNFLSSNSSRFNCFERSIISDDFIVRPATDSELSNVQFDGLDCDKSAKLLLVVTDKNLIQYAQILVELDGEKNLTFYSLILNLKYSDAKSLYTEIVEFFRKNFVVDHIFTENGFPIDEEKYLVKMKNSKFNEIRASQNVSSGMILTAGPSITPLEVCYTADAARSGWNSNWKSYLTLFEQEFARFVGAKYAIATSCCTGALQISLMALDVGPGDEVLVPDLTWVASATAIRDAGATPIFVDVELDSWNMDVEALGSKVTERTKAIVVVHMYGGSARMDKIMKFAEENNLKVVEDAAPAIGTKWQGQNAGTFGDFGCYSFQGAKLLVTGEGGMIVTDDHDLYEKALKIWDQGRNPNKTFWIDDKGVKFKMSNVQAALGLAQIQRADVNISLKRRVFDWYEQRLSCSKSITLNKEVPGSESIYWMTSIRLLESSRIKRDELIAVLRNNGIDSRPVFPAISQYPIWDLNQQSNRNAKIIGETSINLPSGVGLCEAQIEYICNVILQNI